VPVRPRGTFVRVPAPCGAGVCPPAPVALPTSVRMALVGRAAPLAACRGVPGRRLRRQTPEVGARGQPLRGEGSAGPGTASSRSGPGIERAAGTDGCRTRPGSSAGPDAGPEPDPEVVAAAARRPP
jgi:hypothetical protein